MTSRARGREKRPGSQGAGDFGQPDAPPFAFHLTTGPSFPRNMFSSVAHLARANPFNAPHLQLVYDGLAGPSSSPAGPPGPPRRSRNLAAAAVEGEARPCLRRAWRAGKDVPCPPQDGAQLLAQKCQPTLPRPGVGKCQPTVPGPGVGSLALPQGRGRPRHRSLRDLHVLKGVETQRP